ncbi:MAG: peptidoglycan DD-metalloendopeptidase family protein [Oscillospiraceae bacterium]|jgi:hypothetical protein|nr:peptidoglycan DD-metalloendopeptidase family protein [Oscillospiraceae bacterium]
MLRKMFQRNSFHIIKYRVRRTVRGVGFALGKVHGRRVRLAALAISSALAIGFVVAATQGDRTTYAVYFNGKQIWQAGSQVEIVEALQSVETRLAAITGEEISLIDSISVLPADSGAHAAGFMGVDTLETAIMEGLPNVSEMFTASVDGRIIGATDDGAALLRTVKEIVDEYRNENTVEISMDGDIVMRSEYVSDGLIMDIPELREALRRSITVRRADQVTDAVQIPFDTEYIADNTIYKGDEKISVAGVPGVLNVTTKTYYLNGEAQSQIIISSVTQAEPVTQVVLQGTRPRPKTASYGKYIWPVKNVVLTSNFGLRKATIGSANHKGIDVGGSRGTDIFAADGGIVIMAERYSSFGLIVQIRHDNGDITYYAHCSELLVSEGERVYRGQTIAKMGSTGRSGGVHLHFEIHPGGGEAADPLKYLP